ncbi:hypothetical protein KUCAC02_017788 [Chaenocephalus aceratus]|uniref:Uncharacterized protein n=1 Tax=Chaenocephalus aceratus TaxID=36190 RepID=A0ACB9W2A0_CHAAC|nr:hypothetical protein KUCAC02_017788 [Chaenocephalus aceratus]
MGPLGPAAHLHLMHSASFILISEHVPEQEPPDLQRQQCQQGFASPLSPHADPWVPASHALKRRLNPWDPGCKSGLVLISRWRCFV